MLKFASVLNENGKCNVGLGNDIEFYKTIGMKELDVELSELDNQWYLKNKCPQKTQAEKDCEREEYLKTLSITKLDFYKKILLPNGIDYKKLNEILAENSEYKVAWDLCEKVYRGDEVLLSALKKYIPNLLEKDLDNVFEGDL